MTTRPRIDTAQRRARLVVRHHLDRSAPDVPTAVRDLVAVHSSDPITPYLALWARIGGFSTGDLDAALYDDRCLWRLHGMRRTLFVVPAENAPTVTAACGLDFARAERRRLEGWVARALDGAEPDPWLAAVELRTLAALADGTPRRTRELAEMVEGLALRLTIGSGKWTADAPLSSRLLFVLAMEGKLVRADPAGSWVSSQYRWTTPQTWFGQRSGGHGAPPDPAAARAALARAWLGAHGPATTADLRWWTGWTARSTQAALQDSGAVEVDLDDGATGWVMPADLEPVADPVPSVALLPGLDPTVMGWKQRDWYLGDHGPQVFDRNGNAGPTVWVDGRVVGGWARAATGDVVTRVLEDVGTQAAELIDARAAELAAWLGVVTPTPRFRTPLERELSG